MFVPQPIFPHISVRSSYFGRISITKTSSHHPYQALSYEQDLTLNDIAIIQITMTETSRHPPSVSRIITPAVSPRHHHNIPIIQTRPDTVTLQINITQTSPHHHCHTDINTTSLPHRHRDTTINKQTSTHNRSHTNTGNVSGPRFKSFSCLNFKHGFFTFFTTCLARRALPPSP